MGTEDNEPMVSAEDFNALIEQVPSFRAELEKVAEENLKKAEHDVGEGLVTAHKFACGAAIGMLRRFEKRPVKVSQQREQELHHRIVLIVSFLQGVSLCYRAIGHGLYVQAAALLRQEMETIAAIGKARRTGEVREIKGRGQDVGKGNIAWQMNRLHGRLSSATHLTDPAQLDCLYRSAAGAEEVGRPVRLMPVYSKNEAINLWAFQAGLILQLGGEIHLALMDLYGEGANAVESRAWESAFYLLQKGGFLKEVEPASSPEPPPKTS